MTFPHALYHLNRATNLSTSITSVLYRSGSWVLILEPPTVGIDLGSQNDRRSVQDSLSVSMSFGMKREERSIGVFRSLP